jgi:ABC-2 type transport system permease protein
MSAALAAEWLKLRTLRGTWAALATLALGLAGLAVLTWYAADVAGGGARVALSPTEPLAAELAALCLGIAGILAVTSEYTPGTLSLTLLVTPRRGRLAAAKAITAGGLAAAAGTAAVVVTWWTGRLLAAGRPLEVFSDPARHSAQVLAAHTAAVPAAVLAAVGLALCLRSTAASVTVLVATLYVVPILAQLVPGEVGTWVRAVQPAALPGQLAGIGNESSVYGRGLPGPAALALMLAYPAILLALGTLRLRRADA